MFGADILSCPATEDDGKPRPRHFYTPQPPVRAVTCRVTPSHTLLDTAVCKKGSNSESSICHCAVVGAHVRIIYLPSILLTHPWLTRSWREMSQGRTPWWASSTIRCRTTSGRGLPFTNTPPSWFTPPCPGTVRENTIWGESKEAGGERQRKCWLPG